MGMHLIAPEGYDDPARPSGGNNYDRQLVSGLPGVRVAGVAGPWPQPDRTALADLDRALAAVPDGDVVLIDGLLASGSAPVLVPQAHRVCLVVLAHMPLLGRVPGERDVLTAAAGVITTSASTRAQLLAYYRLDPERVRIARPGSAPGPLATGTSGGSSLLCVATVVPHKGQDLLFAALSGLAPLGWTCRCAGALTVDPAFVAHLRGELAAAGLAGRVELGGVRTGAALERAYADADVLIVPSRSETYGMVVTEALARGLPVLAADVGGLPEALGHAPGGMRPGRLFAPHDPCALTAAIRDWLQHPAERERLRAAARARRRDLPGWDTTVAAVREALADFTGAGG